MSTRAISWVAAQGLIACVCFAWIASAAQAQSSPGAGRAGILDPTRPPAALSGTIAPAPLGQPAPRSAQAASNSTPRPLPRLAPVPRLQSVHLPDGGPASALVDGRLMRVGEHIDDWQIARITHEGLLLRSVATTPGSAAGPPATRQRWLPLLPATAAAIGTVQAVDTPLPTVPDPPNLARTAARKEP